jgi:hypothetical protein
VHPTGGSKSLNDTIADGTRLDTIKGPGKSLPARGGDSSKSRKGPAPLPMAKSIDDNPFSFVEEQRAGRPRSDPSTSGASRGSSKDRKAVASEPAEATPAPDRVKEPRRSGIGRRAAADSAKKDNAKKDSAKKDSAKRGETAAAPVDGARPRTRSRGKGGELPQWLWAVVAVAFVVSLLVVGYCVYKLSNPPPVATQPPAKTAKSKDGKHAKDSVDAKAAPAAPAANPAAVNAEALKLDATKQDASKPAAAK